MGGEGLIVQSQEGSFPTSSMYPIMRLLNDIYSAYLDFVSKPNFIEDNNFGDKVTCY